MSQASNPMLNSTWDSDPEGYSELRECWLSERRLNFISDKIRELKPKRVLELGSGTGDLLKDLAKTFPGTEFTGLEPLQAYVEYSEIEAKKAGLTNLKFVAGIGEKLQEVIKDEKFDLILSNDVLHHVESLRAVSDQLIRAAHPNALWLALEPNFLNLYTFQKQYRLEGEKNFWPREFNKIAGKAGWKLENKRYLFLIPPFVKVAPTWAIELEKKFENIPLLAGGVCLTLRNAVI